MTYLNVAAAALNQTPLDWKGNAGRIRNALDAARMKDVHLLALPELAVSGTGCEDAFLAPETWQNSLQILFELLPATRGIVTTLGLPLRVGGSTFNAAALVADGELLGFVCKRQAPFDGVRYDARWFAAWPNHSRFDLKLNGESYPTGDLTFLFEGIRLGVEFFDTLPETGNASDDFSGDFAETLLQPERRCDIVINPTASFFQLGKYEKRRNDVARRSRELNAVYVTANLLGNESGALIYDGSAFIAACGNPIAESRRFSFSDMQLAVATVDIKTKTSTSTQSAAAQNPVETNRNLEFAQAVSLGMFDEMRKVKAGGFTLSLSGGADSATVAALVWLGVQFGVRELGVESFAGRFVRWFAKEGVAALQKPDDLVAELLTCVYQRTKNSSETTRNAAAKLARAIGAKFYEFDVEPLVQSYMQMVERQIGRKLQWETDDIAMQNIQARVRVPGVWLLANLNGSLLLATGNRSEIAVGYSTMDGDNCGGLAPIAGIDKSFLQNWLKWLQNDGPILETARVTLPALRAINVQQPTAELRPPKAGQTDENDLMPYTILNAIEGWMIRDQLSTSEILERLTKTFPDHPEEQLKTWLERFQTLWRRNQWKREKSAPGFHLDTYNLSPRWGCRFPAISGDGATQ
ncbi:MAG: NAD(+) synthase [Planctomycetaceae bacterium]|nr:NAD(+) synthase [Planctomycetaceae bacterium]